MKREKAPTSISKGDTAISSNVDSVEETAGKFSCPVCDGVGWISPDVGFGHQDFGKALPCSCIRDDWENQLPTRLKNYSNLGPLERLTFENILPQGRSPDEDNQKLFTKAYETAKVYSDEPSGWLILTGSSGSGKTHIAAAIANRCIGQRIKTFFIVVPDLLDHLRASFSPNSIATYDELFEQIRNVPLLVLDDLGTQSSSPWASEKLFQLLNHRFNALLPTVVTTKVSLERLDESIQSRLSDPAISTIVAVERRSSVLNEMDSLHLSLPGGMIFETFKPAGRNLAGETKRNLEDAYRAALSYAESLDGWLVLMGPPGRGKTHLAAAIAHYNRRSGNESLFILLSDLLDYLRSTYAPDTKITYDQLFNKVKTIPLLVLDDYGEQAATPWAKEKLYQIINYRYNARLPTVITTALSLDDIDPRISSRLADPGLTMFFAITAPDYRSGDNRQQRFIRRSSVNPRR